MSTFKDDVQLLLSIINNYNRFIISYDEAEKSTGLFIQYSILRRHILLNGYDFSVVTKPLFGRFKFISVSFPTGDEDSGQVLTELGFIEKDGLLTYFFGSQRNQVCTNGNVGVVNDSKAP